MGSEMCIRDRCSLFAVIMSDVIGQIVKATCVSDVTVGGQTEFVEILLV